MDRLLALLFEGASLCDGSLGKAALQFAGEALTMMDRLDGAPLVRHGLVIILLWACKADTRNKCLIQFFLSMREQIPARAQLIATFSGFRFQ